MTCGELDGMLDRLMDGELGDDELRAMEAHGQGCPACAEAVRAAMQMKALFDETEPEADVPLEAQARWRGAVREAAGQGRRRQLIRWAGSAAAAIVVLAGVGLMLNTRGARISDARSMKANRVEARSIEDAADGAALTAAPTMVVEALDEAFEEAAAGPVAAEGAYADMAAGDATAGGAADNGIANAIDSEYAIMAPAAEAMKAAGEIAPERSDDADGALVETDGESAPMCAALALRAPACELRIRVGDLDGACGMVRDLAAEYEGEADVQRLEDGGANVYVEVPADNAGDFLDGLQPIGEAEGPAELPKDAKSDTVLMLLVLYTGI